MLTETEVTLARFGAQIFALAHERDALAKERDALADELVKARAELAKPPEEKGA